MPPAPNHPSDGKAENPFRSHPSNIQPPRIFLYSHIQVDSDHGTAANGPELWPLELNPAYLIYLFMYGLDPRLRWQNRFIKMKE